MDGGEEQEEEPQPWRLELDISGISLRLMQGLDEEEDLRVLARMDIGRQRLQMSPGHLRYSLEHVLLQDEPQELTLLRCFGPAQCLVVKQNGVESSVDLENLQILAHWELFSACVLWCAKAQRLAQRLAPAGSSKAAEAETPQLRLRLRVQQILIYVPTFGEALDEQGGLLLSCAGQVVGAPTRGGADFFFY